MRSETTQVVEVEYQIILVQPDSRRILAMERGGTYHLPLISIPQGARRAKELCKAVLVAWDLYILVLDILMDEISSCCCVIAEVLLPVAESQLTPVSLEMIAECELTRSQRTQIVSVLSSTNADFFSKIGWIDQALEWLEVETGTTVASRERITQYGAGGGASLVCFQTVEGQNYWLKATGDQNRHELAITVRLSELGGAYLPPMIASRPDWNAWLMSGEAIAIEEMPREPLELCLLLEDAVESMAKLQVSAVGHSDDLLGAGAFDQNLGIFERYADELFDYLGEAMALQTSTKAPLLDNSRLQEMRIILGATCRQMKSLELPLTIVHGDLNCSNILVGHEHCVFIDWCEACVGSPLITLQHLLLLNRAENSELRGFIEKMLKEKYKKVWQTHCDPAAMEEGLLYMPLLAAMSSLYGRGDWLKTSQRDNPHCQRYARIVARHMDRAARAPELLEAFRS